jgi:hypothetical protein
MIQFRDFVPRILSDPAFFEVGEYDTFAEAVGAANQWIDQHRVEVINIETVVLPNIWSYFEEETTDESLGITEDSPSYWHQIVRVWYRAGKDERRSTKDGSPGMKE